jgi:arabinofuranan 3-O-arabinosyltransferase
MTPDVLTLRPAQAPATVQPASGRALRATAVHADDATVTVGAGAANWLLLSQNANAGWQATMGSVHLHSTVLDGWRQAFLVPAGSGGTISIRFAPDRGFRAGLLVGAIAVVLLLALALSRCRPVEVAAVEAVTTRRRRAGRTVLIGLALLAVPAAAGPAGAVVLGLVVVIRLATEKWWPNHVTSTSAILIGGGVAVAAAVGAVHPFNSGSSWGADSSAAQLGCALALAALAVSLVPTRRSEKSAAVRSAA